MPKLSRLLKRSKSGNEVSIQTQVSDALKPGLVQKSPSSNGGVSDGKNNVQSLSSIATTTTTTTLSTTSEELLSENKGKKRFFWNKPFWKKRSKLGSIPKKELMDDNDDEDEDDLDDDNMGLARVGRENARTLLNLPHENLSRVSTQSVTSFVMSIEEEECEDGDELVNCKLCLAGVLLQNVWELQSCGCVFCKQCVKMYCTHQVVEGNVNISCPDGQCANKGRIQQQELKYLLESDMYSRFLRFKLFRDISEDSTKTWCPQPGCETICSFKPKIENDKTYPTPVTCPTCAHNFCSLCKLASHGEEECREPKKKSKWVSFVEGRLPPLNNDEDAPIKKCPSCKVLIERDDGCAQMMCRQCKHVFCWYCLKSLDDDFLLRHYDKGPCKNRLGHSRASVVWHRVQVIGIFAGFGMLLLVASPLLLLAAPCILCCRCKVCDKCCDEEEETSSVANCSE